MFYFFWAAGSILSFLNQLYLNRDTLKLISGFMLFDILLCNHACARMLCLDIVICCRISKFMIMMLVCPTSYKFSLLHHSPFCVSCSNSSIASLPLNGVATLFHLCLVYVSLKQVSLIVSSDCLFVVEIFIM